jgi:agmatinase
MIKGARFGPRAIRAASSRQIPYRAFNARAGINPYQSWAKIVDCGDIPITPFDSALAERQMTEAYLTLGQRSTTASSEKYPKLITLGGDHSIALPALRALRKLYDQPIAVIHFDAHLDTWDPSSYPSTWIEAPDPDDPDAVLPPSWFNHGSMFWLAHREGLIASLPEFNNGSACCNVHAGLRCRLSSISDNSEDSSQGWTRISADMIDDIGVDGVVKLILSSIGDPRRPVYLSIDIDVLDPGLAPGTGTPEPGGWTSRELIRIVRSLETLNIVGADIVEVAPAYDGAGEETALAAAQLVFELITNMVKEGLASGQRVNSEGNIKDEL